MSSNPFINTTSGLTPNAGVVGEPGAITGTSSTSQTITTGNLQFQVPPQAAWAPGMFVSIVAATSFSNFMIGVVESYSGTTLTVDVLSAGGSGTFTSWLINLTAGLTGGTYNGTLTVDGTIDNVQADLVLNDPAGAGQGPIVLLESAGTAIGSLGQAARVDSTGTSRDVVLQSEYDTNNLNLNSVGGQVNIQANGTTLFAVNQAGQVVTRTPGAVQAAFKNLKIVNGSTANSQVAITADFVSLFQNSSGFYQTVGGVSVTASTATNGANGLDTGTVADSTWYAVWVIYNQTTVAALLSLSATAPTLPSGYSFAARVGWVLTDSSANLLRTLQQGRKAQYTVIAATNTAALPKMSSGAGIGSLATPTWVGVAVAAFVPSTASRIQVLATNQAGNQMSVVPNNNFGGKASTTNAPPTIYDSNGLFEFAIEGSDVYWANDGATSQLYCLGWEDNI